MKRGDTVVHMIPAAGYYAAYQKGEELTYNPVAAWASSRTNRAGNAWTASIPAAKSGTDRRAATRRALSSSSIETSENAVDSVAPLAPRRGIENNRNNQGGSCPTSHRDSRRVRSPASRSRRSAPSRSPGRPPWRTIGLVSSCGADPPPTGVRRRCDDAAGRRPYRCRSRRRDLSNVCPSLGVARRHRHPVL